MIQTIITYHCTRCDSPDIIKNGATPEGKQKFHCHACGRYGVLAPSERYSEERREEILRAYQERPSMRGISRIFGIARQTLARWLRRKDESLPDLADTLETVQAGDVLELDELWSFVHRKDNQRWVWIALCRRTRQIVAFFIGDRSEASCRQLWNRIPETYRACHTFSDFWEAYQKVFATGQHHPVGKDSGETAHVERWNNTLRQRIARFVRKTLSFSKLDFYHELVLRIFIINYNIICIS